MLAHVIITLATVKDRGRLLAFVYLLTPVAIKKIIDIRGERELCQGLKGMGIRAARGFFIAVLFFHGVKFHEGFVQLFNIKPNKF